MRSVSGPRGCGSARMLGVLASSTKMKGRRVLGALVCDHLLWLDWLALLGLQAGLIGRMHTVCADLHACLPCGVSWGCCATVGTAGVCQHVSNQHMDITIRYYGDVSDTAFGAVCRYILTQQRLFLAALTAALLIIRFTCYQWTTFGGNAYDKTELANGFWLW